MPAAGRFVFERRTGGQNEFATVFAEVKRMPVDLDVYFIFPPPKNNVIYG